MAGGAELLKQSLHRSVRVERRGEGAVVVKRFERKGPLGRALDGRRARREYELLAELSGAGVGVPRPLAVARRGRAYEVEIEWIAGARSLAELCRAGTRLSGELARGLGALLAALHSHGVDHPDLHAGNALVAGDGRVLAVDFDKARRVARLDAARIERDLVSLCAGLRESTAPRWRAAAFAAWWSALEPRLRSALARPEPERIERLARARRRGVVLARARRWTRAGSAVRPLGSGIGFARVGADPARIERALSGAEAPPSFVRVEGPRRRVLALWRAMARLEEHGIAAPRCWLLRTARPAMAWFEPGPARAPASPRELGRWLASLVDRGLWCEGLAPGDVDGTGLAVPRRLEVLEPEGAREKLAPWLAAQTGAAREAFLLGAGAGWRGPGREGRALLARLRDA